MYFCPDTKIPELEGGTQMLELAQELFGTLDFGTDFMIVFFTFLLMLEVFDSIVDIAKGVSK